MPKQLISYWAITWLLDEKFLELEFQKQKVLMASISFPLRQYDNSYIIIYEEKGLLILGTAS